MELALLVYAISILNPISSLLITSAVVLLVGYPTIRCVMCDYGEDPTFSKFIIGLGIFFAVVASILPSEKTAYTMVGAYATQRVYEDPKVQQLSGKVLKVIEDKLDSYIEEVSPRKAK